MRACNCAASRATTLPKPHSVAPASSPERSFSSTCAPRVTNQEPFAGARSVSITACVRARALVVACLTCAAISPVVACAPRPSSAARCTIPVNGASGGRLSSSDRHDSRRSISTAILKTPGPVAAAGPFSEDSLSARTTVWFCSASSAASSSASPLRSAASTQTPRGRSTCAGPSAVMTPRSGSPAASDSSTPRTSTSSKPASPSACRQTSEPAKAWCGR